METVDFSKELEKLNEKIKCIVEAKSVVENESRKKQSVEDLEAIFNKIADLSKPDCKSFSPKTGSLEANMLKYPPSFSYLLCFCFCRGISYRNLVGYEDVVGS